MDDQDGITVLTLGAGQEVGRSCVVVTLGGMRIMFDCGIHIGFRDARRFPDFSLLSPSRRYTEVIHAVVITHFHVDHCGALPYFTEVCGYQGPVYMTYPTKAIMPIMLEDFHKVMTDRQGDRQWFTRQHIQDCAQRVTAVDLNQAVSLGPDAELRALYAGHVLGGAMFHVRVGGRSILYTGDYNTTPDRHLGAACLCPGLRPDLLITESTYATTLRDSKKTRERDLLSEIHRAITSGGKVLIPVFAVGRAQELLLLLDEYWTRLGLEVPIYFSSGMASRANLYYRCLINWTSEQVRAPASRHNAFGFHRVKPWEPQLATQPGPCVLFATPGMLHAGVSLAVFKQWAPGKNNLVVLPGYQVAGTLGGRLMSGGVREVDLGGGEKLPVRCSVCYLSFSAHADVKGILSVVRHSGPRAVMLVHGERSKQQFLAAKISRMFGIECHVPANGHVITVATPPAPVKLPYSISFQQPAAATAPGRPGAQAALASASLALAACSGSSDGDSDDDDDDAELPGPSNTRIVSGVVFARRAQPAAAQAVAQRGQQQEAAQQARSASAPAQNRTAVTSPWLMQGHEAAAQLQAAGLPLYRLTLKRS